MVDMAVARSAYQTAVGLGASDKVMLALFEAGLVESEFRNLSHGDRDSQGFLQQRPSQGWGTSAQVQNVVYATTQFVKRAKPIENRYATAGQLAQAVQRSAFPLRYDQRKQEALDLLAQVKGSTPGDPDSTVPVGSTGDGGIGDAVKTLTNPRTWLRLAMIVSGGILILTALALMGWENAPASVKTAAKAVVLKKVPIK